MKKAEVTSSPNGFFDNPQMSINNMLSSGNAKDMGEFYFFHITPHDAACTTALGAKSLSEPWGFNLNDFVRNAVVL